jgi:hypothetical protein
VQYDEYKLKSGHLILDCEVGKTRFLSLGRGPLADSCTFFSYDSLKELASHKHLSHLSDTVLDEYAEVAE